MKILNLKTAYAKIVMRAYQFDGSPRMALELAEKFQSVITAEIVVCDDCNPMLRAYLYHVTYHHGVYVNGRTSTARPIDVGDWVVFDGANITAMTDKDMQENLTTKSLSPVDIDKDAGYAPPGT